MNITHTINIEKYLTKNPKIRQQLFNIIDQEKRVLLVANPGTGKTVFASELMKKQKKAGHRFVYATFLTAIPKQLKDDFNFDLVCSSYESEWTKRVENQIYGSNPLEDDDLVIGTTLHQLVRFAHFLYEDDIIVIDEAHQLVQLSHQNQILRLREELIKTGAKLLLMTGTPYDHEDERLKLSVVKVEESKPRKDKLIYVPITPALKDITNEYDLSASFIKWYLDQPKHANKKVLVYNNSSKIQNEALVKSINDIAGYNFDNINADLKESEGYEYLMDKQSIRDDIDGIVTTSVIKEGINIKSKEVEFVIILGQHTEKDEKQIAKRVRGKKPLEVIRIFNEPTEEQIDDIGFDIDLVYMLVESYKTQPERLRKNLQRFAHCGESLKSTGILDPNVEQVNEVKAQDIIEQQFAQKCILKDYLKRNAYNDIEVHDGKKYLLKKYKKYLPEEKDIGKFAAKLKIESDIAREAKEKLLKNILLVLFGNSSFFDYAIDFLKQDLIYSKGGELLEDIDTATINRIKASGFVAPPFDEEPLEDLDDDQIEDLMEFAAKELHAKYRDEKDAVLKILHFFIENADDLDDVLPSFYYNIDPNMVEWHSERLMLSEKLDWIKKNIDRNYKIGSLLEKAALKNEADHVRLRVMRKVESQLKKYGVIHLDLLFKYIENDLGDKRYIESVELDKKDKVKLFVYAMGTASENVSWKRSNKNKTKFDKLWFDLGKQKTPVNGNSIRVHELKICTSKELFEEYCY